MLFYLRICRFCIVPIAYVLFFLADHWDAVLSAYFPLILLFFVSLLPTFKICLYKVKRCLYKNIDWSLALQAEHTREVSRHQIKHVFNALVFTMRHLILLLQNNIDLKQLKSITQTTKPLQTS